MPIFSSTLWHRYFFPSFFDANGPVHEENILLASRYLKGLWIPRLAVSDLASFVALTQSDPLLSDLEPLRS